jgi:hypothetical protein
MNVEIGTEAPIFLFWEYLLQFFGILSLQCIDKKVEHLSRYKGFQPHFQVLSSTASAIDKKVEQLSRYKGFQSHFQVLSSTASAIDKKVEQLSRYMGFQPHFQVSPPQPLPLTRKWSSSPGIRDSIQFQVLSSTASAIDKKVEQLQVKETLFALSPGPVFHSLCH